MRRPVNLAAALVQRARRLSTAFGRVVFAQVRISLLNTFFTGIYLAVILPMFGIDLPLKKTLIAVTFIVGLLPVIGNLISNTIIIIVSLSNLLPAAVSSLLFLIVIHKLEYFLNARIIGRRIEARAWELLIAMLVMEAAFGMAGLIAAPIYYAYIKSELAQLEPSIREPLDQRTLPNNCADWQLNSRYGTASAASSAAIGPARGQHWLVASKCRKLPTPFGDAYFLGNSGIGVVTGTVDLFVACNSRTRRSPPRERDGGFQNAPSKPIREISNCDKSNA